MTQAVPVPADPVALIRAAQARLERAAAKAGLESDPLGDCFAALGDCLGAMGEMHADMKAGGARGLTPEGEAALSSRVIREVRVGLAILPRAHLLRTSLFGAAILTGAVLLTAAIAYPLGRTHGAEARIAALCQGPAVQPQPKGGTACSFWLVAPARERR